LRCKIIFQINIVHSNVFTDCGALPEINNGTLSAEETGKSTYLSKAIVTCDTGFDSSNDSIVCQASGVWENVSCIIKGKTE
jgi:hypothetical protein